VQAEKRVDETDPEAAIPTPWKKPLQARQNKKKPWDPRHKEKVKTVRKKGEQRKRHTWKPLKNPRFAGFAIPLFCYQKGERTKEKSKASSSGTYGGKVFSHRKGNSK